MKISQLADLLLQARLSGDHNTEISGIEIDSRLVERGDLFVCIRGERFDGREYVEDAARKGAVAILTDTPLAITLPQIIYHDVRYAMAVIATHFYHYPSHKLRLIGVTGTNGKTTTAYILEQLLARHQLRTGFMGTIYTKIGSEQFDVKNTTQEAHAVQQNLYKMMQCHTDVAVMEVSSHALSFGRVMGCDFRTVIFTNLTQDHLDFHGSMEQYQFTKGLLFSRLGNTFTSASSHRKYAVLNEDDQASTYFKTLTTAQVVSYGLEKTADVRATHVNLTAAGMQFNLTSFAGEAHVQTKLIGKFNVYNVLAAVTAALLEGIPLTQIAETLAEIKPVAGRMELVEAGQQFTVIVDYAHTPDGMKNVLQTVKSFVKGNIVCVFGCGGDRDRSKRPQMGRLAAELSDSSIITSDNPRSEEPIAIMHEIEDGIKQANRSKHTHQLIPDRAQAIATAVEMASPEDVVLILGKGHETYQEIKGKRTHFDDRIIAQDALRSRFHC